MTIKEEAPTLPRHVPPEEVDAAQGSTNSTQAPNPAENALSPVQQTGARLCIQLPPLQHLLAPSAPTSSGSAAQHANLHYANHNAAPLQVLPPLQFQPLLGDGTNSHHYGFNTSHAGNFQHQQNSAISTFQNQPEQLNAEPAAPAPHHLAEKKAGAEKKTAAKKKTRNSASAQLALSLDDEFPTRPATHPPPYVAASNSRETRNPTSTQLALSPRERSPSRPLTRPPPYVAASNAGDRRRTCSEITQKRRPCQRPVTGSGPYCVRHQNVFDRANAPTPNVRYIEMEDEDAEGRLMPNQPPLASSHRDNSIPRDRNREAEMRKVWIRRLLGAINTPFDQDAFLVSEMEFHGFLRDQQKTLNGKIRMEARRESDRYSVEWINTRMHLLWLTVLRFHRGGRSVHPVGGDSGGYGLPNITLSFVERLQAIETLMRRNKLVVMDVIEGKGILALVHDPHRFRRRKQQNKTSNKVKEEALKEKKRMENLEQQPDTAAQQFEQQPLQEPVSFRNPDPGNNDHHEATLPQDVDHYYSGLPATYAPIVQMQHPTLQSFQEELRHSIDESSNGSLEEDFDKRVDGLQLEQHVSQPSVVQDPGSGNSTYREDTLPQVLDQYDTGVPIWPAPTANMQQPTLQNFDANTFANHNGYTAGIGEQHETQIHQMGPMGVVTEGHWNIQALEGSDGEKYEFDFENEEQLNQDEHHTLQDQNVGTVGYVLQNSNNHYNNSAETSQRDLHPEWLLQMHAASSLQELAAGTHSNRTLYSIDFPTYNLDAGEHQMVQNQEGEQVNNDMGYANIAYIDNTTQLNNALRTQSLQQHSTCNTTTMNVAMEHRPTDGASSAGSPLNDQQRRNAKKRPTDSSDSTISQGPSKKSKTEHPEPDYLLKDHFSASPPSLAEPTPQRPLPISLFGVENEIHDEQQVNPLENQATIEAFLQAVTTLDDILPAGSDAELPDTHPSPPSGDCDGEKRA